MATETNNKLHLAIVSTESTLTERDIASLIICGIEGELEILPGHLPLITTLKPGSARIRYWDEQHQWTEDLFFIASGILEVQPFQVTILADTGEAAHQLNEDEIAAAEHAIRDQLNSTHEKPDLHKAYQKLAELSAKTELLRRLKNRKS